MPAERTGARRPPVESDASREGVLETLQATLIVLAGGQSVRMGRSKAALEIGAGSLLGAVIRRLEGAFAEALVGGLSGPPPSDVTVPIVPDLREGAGPLAGIEAGLRASAHLRAFVVGCDMPGVTPALGRLLIRLLAGNDAAVVRINGRPEPVCAAYGATSLRAISAYLDAGQRRAADVLDRLVVRFVDERELVAAGIDVATLVNLNTPDEYEAFKARLGHS